MKVLIHHIVRLRAVISTLAPTKEKRTHARRLRRLRALALKEAPENWARIEPYLTRSDWRCPRFAGIVEESGERRVILADSEYQLAAAMELMLNDEIPIGQTTPMALVDLDTDEHRAAICDVSVQFLPTVKR